MLPAIIYNYVDAQTRFYIVPWVSRLSLPGLDEDHGLIQRDKFGLIGFALTYIFLPDMTGLDLKEQERYFSYVKAGRANEYHGIAIHPKHLSWWEHYILKRSSNYDPALDKKAKIAELKALYFKLHRDDFAEKTLAEEIYDHDDASIISQEVKAFFERNTPKGSPLGSTTPVESADPEKSAKVVDADPSRPSSSL